MTKSRGLRFQRFAAVAPPWNPRCLGDRFWSKVVKTPRCWLWIAGTNRQGYGLLNVQGTARLAHRLAWEEESGPIPAGMCLLHQCDTPRCVRPGHTFLGTRRDNAADRDAKGRTRLN